MPSDAEVRVGRAVDDKLDSGTRWLLRREIDELPRLLPEGEEIVHMAQGRLEGGTGLVVVTDRRLMFVEKGIGHRLVEDFRYLDLFGVQADVSVVSSALTLSRADADTTISRVYPKARTMEIADYVRRRTAPGVSGHRLGREPARE